MYEKEQIFLQVQFHFPDIIFKLTFINIAKIN